MNRIDVKIVTYPEHYKPEYFCFNLIFDDGSYKYYELSRYEIAAARMNERDLIENLAQDYFESLTGVRPIVCLIFY